MMSSSASLRSTCTHLAVTLNSLHASRIPISASLNLARMMKVRRRRGRKSRLRYLQDVRFELGVLPVAERRRSAPGSRI